MSETTAVIVILVLFVVACSYLMIKTTRYLNHKKQ